MSLASMIGILHLDQFFARAASLVAFITRYHFLLSLMVTLDSIEGDSDILLAGMCR
jgi:hypothetical protein